MAKEAYYFSHDANARNDEKVLMLRAEHGLEGYGIFWILIEMMFESSDTCLCHSKIKGIAVSCNIDITVLESVINTCIEEKLFDSDGEVFYSDSLIKRKAKYLDIKTKKSEAGKKGMAKRWENHNSVITDGNSVITKDNKGKESKGKESKQDIPYKDIVDHLNQLSDSKYKYNSRKTQESIKARFNEGFTLQDFLSVIQKKSEEWKHSKDMAKFLRPETLFGTKFEGYLNQPEVEGNGRIGVKLESNALGNRKPRRVLDA